MSDAPKPCSCGASSISVQEFYYKGRTVGWEIICDDCELTSGDHPTRWEALRVWNELVEEEQCR